VREAVLQQLLLTELASQTGDEAAALAVLAVLLLRLVWLVCEIILVAVTFASYRIFKPKASAPAPVPKVDA
jgi:hypothetical protein